MTDDFRKALDSIIQESSGHYLFDTDLVDFSKKYILKNKGSLPPLYRYSPADYNNIYNLEEKTVFLSEAGSLNDVFEGLSGAVDKEVLKHLDKLHDLAYIKSFSEKNDDLLMWSTYAKEYSGICVEYDVNRLPDNVLLHLFSVRYSNERVIKNNLNITYEELMKMKYALENGDDYEFTFSKDIMGLFLTKSCCWEYEKEWRLVYSFLQLNVPFDEIDENISEEECLYFKKWEETGNRIVSFDCIQKIYAGPRIKEHIKNHLEKIAKKLGVDLICLELDEKSYELVGG